MLKPQYMTYDGHHLVTKNKLQIAVADYLKSLDRTLIKNEELAFIKKQVLLDIDRLNKEHKRCKPLKPSWFKIDNDWMLSGIYFSNFKLYQINKIIM